MSTDDLAGALAAVPAGQRRAITRAWADLRDRHAGRPLGTVYAELAALAADVSAQEAATLRAIEDDALGVLGAVAEGG